MAIGDTIRDLVALVDRKTAEYARQDAERELEQHCECTEGYHEPSCPFYEPLERS